MGQDPDAIREEIEQTRTEMSETVEAVGYKADAVNESTPSTGDVKQAAKKGASVAQENPLGLAIGAVAVGFVAGLLIPSTRVEDEKLGSVADDVKEKAKETGQEAVEHGKQVAQDAAQSVQETVKESGQEHAQELKDSAQQNAQDVGERPQYTAR